MSVRMSQQAVEARLRPQVRKIVGERLRAQAGEAGVAIEAEDWPDVLDGTTRMVMGELKVPPTGEIERLALGVMDGILGDARQEVNGDLALDLLLLYRWNRGEEERLSPAMISRLSWMERYFKQRLSKRAPRRWR